MIFQNSTPIVINRVNNNNNNNDKLIDDNIAGMFPSKYKLIYQRKCLNV
jgi:hypothetical protein